MILLVKMAVVGQLAKGWTSGQMKWMQYQNTAFEIWVKEYVEKLQDPIKPWVSLATCSERWDQGRGCPVWRGWSPPFAQSPAPPQGSTQTSWQGQTWWSWYQKWLSRFYGNMMQIVVDGGSMNMVVGANTSIYKCVMIGLDAMCQMKATRFF